jgi:hypothetical protein
MRLRNLASVAFLLSLAPALSAQATKSRTLKICVAGNADPGIEASAERIRAGISSSPLLTLLAANGVSLEDSGRLASGPIEARAFHHLILVGLPGDPLIQAAWQHEAGVEDGGLYIFGFGHLRGTLGYLESDRNPFLHSQGIAAAPYETEVITITGTSPAGVKLAVDAFLTAGLVNGVVAAPGWSRPSKTILDRDPLTLPLAPVTLAPAAAGDAHRIALTQASENEYRDVLQDTGLTPSAIWRVKYSEPGAWDGAAPLEALAPRQFLAGLHRRAFGNTLWIAQFASPTEASAAAKQIADAAHLQPTGSGWSGPQPFGNTTAEPHAPASAAPPPLTLWTNGSAVLLSTVAQLTH